MAKISSVLKTKIPKIYFLILYIFFLFVIPLVPYIFRFKNPFLFSIGMVFVYIAGVEVIFRALYKLIFRKPYSYIPKIPFNKIHIEPHPYLPFAYKKKFTSQKETFATYPLHRKKGYMFPELGTNNFRHVNGPNGDRDIEVPKPKGLIRINCLGASTTGNYIRYNGKNYSYPMELEDILQNAFPGQKIEVNNCGQGGYTSAEMLIKFLLDTIDTEPDIVVICYAYNDLIPSITPHYQSDHSHARRNLGEVYHLYKLAAMIPAVRLASFNFLINYCLFSQNIRFSLLRTVSRGKVDLKSNFYGMGTYKRNLKHIIDVCKANNIHVVLSTFNLYLYPEVQKKEVCVKIAEGIKLENDVVRSLAGQCGLSLVDNARLVPQEDKNFVDMVHFTPEGMHLAAENISSPIIEYIAKKTQPNG